MSEYWMTELKLYLGLMDYWLFINYGFISIILKVVKKALRIKEWSLGHIKAKNASIIPFLSMISGFTILINYQ